MNNKWLDKFSCNVEEIDAFNRKLTYTLLDEYYSKFLEEIEKRVGKQVIISGYRPGKAPLSLVKVRYPEAIDQEAARVMYECFQEKLESIDLDIINHSDFTTTSALKDNKIELTCKICIAPSFELPDYSSYGSDYEFTPSQTAEEIVKKELEESKEHFGEMSDIKDSLKEGDMICCSFESDFVLPEVATEIQKKLAKNDDAWYILKTPESIPGLINAFNGANVGSEVSFSATYPEDWHEKLLAGKTVAYKMLVKSAQRRKPIDGDEALAERLGLENVDALYKNYQKHAEYQIRQEKVEAYVSVIREKLLANTQDFDFPEAMLESAIEDEFNASIAERIMGGAKREDFLQEKEEKKDELKAKAIQTLRERFILRKIAEKENVQVSNDEISSEVYRISQYTKIDPKALVNLLKENGRLQDIVANIMVNKTLVKLASKFVSDDVKENKSVE